MPIDFSTLGDNLVPEGAETIKKRKIVEDQNKNYDEWLANKGDRGIIPFLKDVSASAIPGLVGTADTISLISDLLSPATSVSRPLSSAIRPLTDVSRGYAQDLAAGGQPEGIGKVAAQAVGGLLGSYPEMAAVAGSGPIGWGAHGALKALESGQNPITEGLKGGTTGLAFKLAENLNNPIAKIVGTAGAMTLPNEASRVISGQEQTPAPELLSNFLIGAALATRGAFKKKSLPQDKILDVITTTPEQRAQRAVQETKPTKIVPPETVSPERTNTPTETKWVNTGGEGQDYYQVTDPNSPLVGTSMNASRLKELGFTVPEVPKEQLPIQPDTQKPTISESPGQTITLRRYTRNPNKILDNRTTSFFDINNMKENGEGPENLIAISPSKNKFIDINVPESKIYRGGNSEIDELISKSPDFVQDTANYGRDRWTQTDKNIADLLEKKGYLGFKYPETSKLANEVVILDPTKLSTATDQTTAVAPEPPTVSKSKEGIILYENKTPTIPIEEKLLTPEQKLIDAIKTAKPIRGKQEQLYTEERGRRMNEALKVGEKSTGEKGFYDELAQMKGKLPRVVFESIRDKFKQEDVDLLFNKIKNNSQLGDWEKFPARLGLAKLLGEYGGGVPTENELALLDTVFGKTFTKTVQEAQPFLKRMKETGLQIANIPRSLMASFDLSAPFRQGAFFVSRYKQFFPAFNDMFKAMGSDKGFKAIGDEITKMPTFDMMKKSGLALTEMDKLMTGREERFQSQLAEKIPVVGKMVRASGRAYTGFLNKLRADVFNDLIQKADLQGLNPRKNMDLVKEIAHFVNAGTGRGSLGMGLERSATALNAFFFSPRLMASRLTLLNPAYYIKASPFVRKEAIKSLFGFAGTAMTIMGLAKLVGAKVEDDPRNSDFAKIKIGNTRIDLLGGFQQYIRAAAQIASGKYISSITGKEVTLGEGYKPLTRYDIAMRQIESKEAPVASMITTLLRGQDRMGQPINYSKEIVDRFTPMILADTIEIAKDNPDLIPAGLAGIFGFGIQTYQPKVSKRSANKKFDFSTL